MWSPSIEPKKLPVSTLVDFYWVELNFHQFTDDSRKMLADLVQFASSN